MYLQDTKTKKKFYTRSEVLWGSDFVLSDIEFVCDSRYDSIDWTIEPSESLEELKKQRAIQLRDKYDYIILYFSGGSDSITVLNSFLKNNIFLDEVVIYSYPEIPSLRVNGEYSKNYLNVIDYKGKKTFIDFNFEMVNRIHKQQLWYHMGDYTGLLHTPSRWKIDWYENNDFVESYKRKGEVCHLFGGISPLIKKHGNKYYSEIAAASVGMASLTRNNEQFFTTPDFPTLHCKQSHIVVNHWKKHYPEDTQVVEKNFEQYITTKRLLRDEFNLKISSIKGSSDITRLLVKGSEANDILSYYKNVDESFYNMYIDSTIKEFASTSQYVKRRGIYVPPELNKRFYICEGIKP